MPETVIPYMIIGRVAGSKEKEGVPIGVFLAVPSLAQEEFDDVCNNINEDGRFESVEGYVSLITVYQSAFNMLNVLIQTLSPGNIQAGNVQAQMAGGEAFTPNSEVIENLLNSLQQPPEGGDGDG